MEELEQEQRLTAMSKARLKVLNLVIKSKKYLSTIDNREDSVLN